jgi:hypothetical protein
MFLVAVLTAHVQSVQRDQQEMPIGAPDTSEVANAGRDWQRQPSPKAATAADEILSQAPDGPEPRF